MSSDTTLHYYLELCGKCVKFELSGKYKVFVF